MLVVKKVYPAGWVWRDVELVADCNMTLVEKRLGFDALRAPRLESWLLQIYLGEVFYISLPKSQIVNVGDAFALDEFSHHLTIASRWARE